MLSKFLVGVVTLTIALATVISGAAPASASSPYIEFTQVNIEFGGVGQGYSGDYYWEAAAQASGINIADYHIVKRGWSTYCIAEGETLMQGLCQSYVNTDYQEMYSGTYPRYAVRFYPGTEEAIQNKKQFVMRYFAVAERDDGQPGQLLYEWNGVVTHWGDKPQYVINFEYVKNTPPSLYPTTSADKPGNPTTIPTSGAGSADDIYVRDSDGDGTVDALDPDYNTTPTDPEEPAGEGDADPDSGCKFYQIGCWAEYLFVPDQEVFTDLETQATELQYLFPFGYATLLFKYIDSYEAAFTGTTNWDDDRFVTTEGSGGTQDAGESRVYKGIGINYSILGNSGYLTLLPSSGPMWDFFGKQRQNMIYLQWMFVAVTAGTWAYRVFLPRLGVK